METFFAEYSKQLTALVKEKNNEYVWPAANLPIVLARMRVALERGSYNKDGPAFIRTCKALGIKHTYKAINHFILSCA